jgi:bifunctional DNA-binding transcriptional regulator/antitoxin component of YhaV-PrlF toxin-antitoxin module
MIMRKRLKITSGGQVSVPAEVRRRWRTSTLVAEDLGDRLVLHPAPDDPIEAAAGALAADFRGVSTKDLRRRAREDECVAEQRRPLG